MHVLIAIALKSLIISGAALGLLALMKQRSAAERSWVAHVGLVALVLLALAPLILPNWYVEAPAVLGQASTPEPAAQAPLAASPTSPVALPVADDAAAAPLAAISLPPAAIATAAYAVPAAILLIITLLALMRLIALRARADVLVDGHWLSALARAQRRMGFKHGTALLTSDELGSPISWGLMRPVILLNSRAVEASGEAEAIIAHELAHVARMDWIKLLLARIATALFWFNPLVWALAREAHQLREEAADDAVLAADIADTDYAQLLVGVARHECPGLLLWAHGVAPSRSSLARRVARVLDGKSVRGPVARSFALGVFAGAVIVAAPLAALTLTPGGGAEPRSATTAAGSMAHADQPAASYYPETASDIPHIIADGVSTSVSTAVAAVSPEAVKVEVDPHELAMARAEAAREIAKERAKLAAEQARDLTKEKIIAIKLDGRRDSAIDRAIQLKASGVSAEYVAQMIAAAPHLARLDPSEFVGMRAVGVSPEFTREWISAGFRHISPDQLTEARAVGLSGSYVRQMIDAGMRASFDDYVQLRAVGVRPEYVRSLRRSGYTVRNADQLVEMQAMGITARDLKVVPPVPPVPPKPPRVRNPVVHPDPDPDDG